MTEMRFSFDERGRARVEIAPPYKILEDFLEDDVQWDLRDARELRQMVVDYREGRRSEEWDGTGNAWTLYLRPEGAYLELAVSPDFEPNAEVPLEVLDQALAGWEELMEQVWDSWEARGIAQRPEGPGWERRHPSSSSEE